VNSLDIVFHSVHGDSPFTLREHERIKSEIQYKGMVSALEFYMQDGKLHVRSSIRFDDGIEVSFGTGVANQVTQ
jgi:hypothetical protein